MIENRDSLLVGAIAGIIGSIPVLVINFFTYRWGISTVLLSQVAASIFVEPSDAGLPISLFLGTVANLTIGMLLGIGLIILYRITGYDYFYVKAFAYALFLWLLVWGLVPNLHLTRLVVTYPRSNLIALILRFVFALTTAWTIKYLQEKNILKA